MGIDAEWICGIQRLETTQKCHLGTPDATRVEYRDTVFKTIADVHGLILAAFNSIVRDKRRTDKPFMCVLEHSKYRHRPSPRLGRLGCGRQKRTYSRDSLEPCPDCPGKVAVGIGVPVADQFRRQCSGDFKACRTVLHDDTPVLVALQRVGVSIAALRASVRVSMP